MNNDCVEVDELILEISDYRNDYASVAAEKLYRTCSTSWEVYRCLKDHVHDAWLPDSAYGPGYAGIRGGMVRKMYASGFLNATSIGFAPWETRPLVDKRVRDPGTIYTKSELLDISCVSVPANPGALMDRANDPEYRTMLKSWATEAIRRCEGGSCNKDEEVYLVDEEILYEELTRAVAKFEDSETFIVDEEMLNDEIKSYIQRHGLGV